MKNPAPYIRQSLYTLLNGNVVYDSTVVPVYESEYVGPSVKYKIEIAGMDGFNEEDKRQYNYDYRTTLEIIGEGHSWVRKHVDAIGNTVMGLLKPTKYTTGLPNNEDWQFTNVKVHPPTYLEDEGADGLKIMRLLLKLDFDIHDRN